MRIKKISEANINLKELERPAKNQPGKLRGDILIDKIDKGEEVSFKLKNKKNFKSTIVNDEEIIGNITDTTGRFDPDKAKSFFTKGRNYVKNIQVAEDDNLYQLNDIEKTSDFGSSGGSSLGSVETRTVECIQCLFLALRQTKAENSLTEADVDDLYDEFGDIRKDLLDSIRVPIQITAELIDKYLENWLSTFICTANALFEVRPVFTKDKDRDDNILSRRKTYIFYQIGYARDFTQMLAETYRSFPETTGIPIAKWTPSDIWAVHKTQHRMIIDRVFQCQNINQLNEVVDSLFDQKSLRGISLKKLKLIERTEDVVLVINKITPMPEYTFNRVITSNNPLGSLGIKIVVDQISSIENQNQEQVMDVRTFSGQFDISDISGEVIGHSARHGKVGLTRINKIISDSSKKNGIDVSLIETKEQLVSKSYEFLVQEIEELNNKIKSLGHSVGTKNSIQSRVRMISKYQALRFADILYTYPNLADEIIEKVFYYAMAIKNDVFECPKYVRII